MQVFNPNTIRMAQTNSRFRELVESSALETLEKNFHVSFDRASLVPGGDSYLGAPVASVLRNKRPDFEQKQSEQASLPSDDPKSQMPYPYSSSSSSSASASASDSASGSKPVSSPTKSAAAASATKPVAEPSKQVSEPKYKLKYRNELEWQDFALRTDSAPQRPKEVVVEIELPGITSAAEVTLDLYERSLELISNPGAPAAYKLSLKLGYPVDENRAGAKFDKHRQTLSITAPILPAPPQPQCTFVSPSAVSMHSFASSDSGASEPEASCTHDELDAEAEGGAAPTDSHVAVATPELSASATAVTSTTTSSIGADTALRISSGADAAAAQVLEHIEPAPSSSANAALPGGAAESSELLIASAEMRSCSFEEATASASASEETIRRKKCISPVPRRNARSRDESDSPRENDDDSPPASLDRRHSNDSGGSDRSSNDMDGSSGQLSASGERRHKKSNLLDPSRPRRSKHVSFCDGTQDHSAEKSHSSEKYRSARATADDFFTYLPGCGVPKNRRRNKVDKKEGNGNGGGDAQGGPQHHRRGARKEGDAARGSSSSSTSSDSGSDTLPSPPANFSLSGAGDAGNNDSPFSTPSSTSSSSSPLKAGASLAEAADSDDEPPLSQPAGASSKPLIEELDVQVPVPSSAAAAATNPTPAPQQSSDVQTMLSWKEDTSATATASSGASKTAAAPLTNSLIYELDE